MLIIYLCCCNEPKYLGRQAWANNVDCDIRLRQMEQSDHCLHCLPFRLHLLDTLLLKPHSWNFRIQPFFSGVQIFSRFYVIRYSTIVGKDLIFRYPAWIFQFFHATKPQNSHGFCVELAGITREFSRELQEIFARNSRMVTRDAWSLLHIPEDPSFQHRSQKSREDNRSHVHAVVLLYTIKRLSHWLIISFYSDFFSFIFIFIYWWRVFNETNK